MNQTFENPLIEKRKLQKKRERVREYLRDYGILPTYGTPLTEEQQKIIDQIQNNDFSYQENFVRNKEIIRIGQIKTSVYHNIWLNMLTHKKNILYHIQSNKMEQGFIRQQH